MIIVPHIATSMKMEKDSANGFWDVKRSVRNVMKDIILIKITFVLNFLKIASKPNQMEHAKNVKKITKLIQMETAFQSLEDHVMTTALFINTLI